MQSEDIIPTLRRGTFNAWSFNKGAIHLGVLLSISLVGLFCVLTSEILSFKSELLLIIDISILCCILFTYGIIMTDSYDKIPYAFRKTKTIIILYLIGVLLQSIVSISILRDDEFQDDMLMGGAICGLLSSFLLTYKMIMYMKLLFKEVICNLFKKVSEVNDYLEY